ncbi:glycoside hydrolase family 16 protein [Cadophora sp. DSE1049]|nr:glycoside hydrolase family 16 protein [Cadophora sp. DSE1049]
MALSSSSNLRTFFFSVLLLLLFVSSVQAIVSSTYVLDTEYSGPTFFDGFEFWTDPDPTHGFVSYQSQSSSLSKSLISTSNNVARMSVDSRTVLRSDGSEGGRESVRISSKKRFTHGLFLADVEHMPGSECGVWPAYWMFGPDWPNGGEIDIIEGILQQTNVMTLHTGDTCTISGTQSLGTLQTNDCNQNNGYGCSISSSSPISYGDSFNSANGGVYATQWTSDYIRIWYFPRSSIPEDIVNGEPDPSNWGLPDGNFQGNCDVDANFAEHQIVFDTTFCGDWAGSVWSGDPVCSKKANTCVDYVASEPGAFADAYWDINYVKVFTLTDEPAPTSTLVASSSSSKITSTLVTSGSTSKETSKDATSNSTSKSTSTLDTSSSTSKSTSPTVSISTLKSISKPDSTTHLTSTTEPSSLQSRTTRPSAPTPFATSPQNTTLPKPPTLRGWSYIGCISSSTSNFPAFILSATNENMTDTLCASTCSTSAYLGTFVTSCFCGSDLLDTTTLSDSACTIPCPGIPSQVCGGVRVNSRSSKRSEFEHQHRHLEQPVGALEKRQGLGFILTVYQNGLLLPDPQSLSSSPTPDPSEVHFLPTTGGIPTPSTTLTPLSTLVGIGMGVSSSESTEATAVTSGVHFAPTGTNAAELGSVVTSASPAGTLIGIGKGGGLSISISTSTSTAITILNLDIVAQATTITTVVTSEFAFLSSSPYATRLIHRSPAWYCKQNKTAMQR